MQPKTDSKPSTSPEDQPVTEQTDDASGDGQKWFEQDGKNKNSKSSRNMFQIERDAILKPLGAVHNVVERRQTLPILANVLIRSDGESLHLTGTDLEVEVKCSIEGVPGETGECTVTARKLFDICRALPDDGVIEFVVDADKAQIKSGKSRFSLQTLPASDFPQLETQNWDERITLPQSGLKQLLEETAFSMAHQDVRYYLNGLLLERQKGLLRAVATDGHRLAKSDLSVEGGDATPRQAIVPRKAILELNRLLADSDDTVTLAFNNNHMRAEIDSTVFTTKLIDGRFPDYQAVMAPKLDKIISVPRGPFIDVLARAAILTNEKFRGIRLMVDKDRMAVTAANPEQEEASDEMAVEYGEEPLEIGFNVSYLIEALRALPGDTVELRLKDANSSCTLNAPGNEETLYLVMPMRL